MKVVLPTTRTGRRRMASKPAASEPDAAGGPKTKQAAAKTAPKAAKAAVAGPPAAADANENLDNNLKTPAQDKTANMFEDSVTVKTKNNAAAKPTIKSKGKAKAVLGEIAVETASKDEPTGAPAARRQRAARMIYSSKPPSAAAAESALTKKMEAAMESLTINDASSNKPKPNPIPRSKPTPADVVPRVPKVASIAPKAAPVATATKEGGDSSLTDRTRSGRVVKQRDIYTDTTMADRASTIKPDAKGGVAIRQAAIKKKETK